MREMIHRWQELLDDVFEGVGSVQAWQDVRWRFADAVRSALVADVDGASSLAGPAIYFVDIASAAPLYVGETMNARRRIRDLPVGESHHLSNTFPPEVWTGVYAVAWPRLQMEALEVLASVDTVLVGRAVEHALQLRFRPPANMRTRVDGGRWRERDLLASSSQGAVLARERREAVDALSDAVAEEYAATRTALAGETAVYRPSARGVAPRAVLRDVLSAAE